MMKAVLRISILAALVLSQTGCASFNKKLKALLGGKSTSTAATDAPKKELITYSENPSLIPNVKRQYKRTTRESLEADALLNERAGSLWVMEGQGAYLFSQNIMRMIGDPLAVQLEGDPKDQLVAKVDVIRDLLTKLEDRQRARLRGPASANAASAADGAEAKPEEKADTKSAANTEAKPGDDEFKVKNVPTRVVERTSDGNYRVKGTQPFMIKGREYKVIVTGVVRAEDFSDAGVSSTKLLDPKFDIVSAKRSETM